MDFSKAIRDLLAEIESRKRPDLEAKQGSRVLRLIFWNDGSEQAGFGPLSR